MAFRLIPAREFWMEAFAEGDAEEEPRHRVVITEPFWMGETPVTGEQFAVWTRAEGIQHENHFTGKPSHPAGNLDWKLAVSASDDQCVRFWKRDGAGAWWIQGRTIALGRSVRALAVNARLDVAVGFVDGGVGVYREDGTRRWSTADHQGAVTSLAFLSDDDHLASGGADGVVRLYRQQTGHPPVTLRAEAGGVNALAWRPRAVELVAGYSKGRAIAWRVDVPSLARAACEFAGRDLTEEEWTRFVGPSVPYERTCGDARTDFPGQ